MNINFVITIKKSYCWSHEGPSERFRNCRGNWMHFVRPFFDSYNTLGLKDLNLSIFNKKQTTFLYFSYRLSTEDEYSVKKCIQELLELFSVAYFRAVDKTGNKIQ